METEKNYNLKIMKRIKYFIWFLALGLMTSSCEKFLEEELVTDVSAASYYTTEDGLEDAVTATYSFLKPFFGQEMGAAMTTFGTDIWTNGADGGHKYFNFYDTSLNASSSYITDAWATWYRGINQANGVINRSADVDMDEAKKNVWLAEVRFLRAMYYFLIVTTYGDAHISLEETLGVEVEANKTPQAEIYAQAIVPDLEFAIANLAAEPFDGQYGRAIKPAAEFLLGKVLLTRSYTGFADGTDASRAETLFGNVINNYGFSLLDDVADLWDIGNQENSEMVFVIPNSKSQVDSGIDDFGHRWHLYFLQEYDVRRGMTRDIANGRPWKRHRPTEFMLTLWDRDIDSRYDASFKHVWFANKDEPAIDAIPPEPARAALSIGDSAIFIPGPGKDIDWPQSRQDIVPYIVITSDEYSERLFPSMNKWIDPTRPDRQKVQGQRDFILMRLGDAYLLRAEARLAQNDPTNAAADINVIRMRSAMPGQEAATQITPADVNLDFLLDERARELVGEGHRWWDLARTGKLVERVRLYNPEGAPNIQDYHTVRPIPQDQIDRTLGGYPQNPGYPQ